MFFICVTRSLIAIVLGCLVLVLSVFRMDHCWYAVVFSAVAIIFVGHTMYAVMMVFSKFGGPITMDVHLPRG